MMPFLYIIAFSTQQRAASNVRTLPLTKNVIKKTALSSLHEEIYPRCALLNQWRAPFLLSPLSARAFFIHTVLGRSQFEWLLSDDLFLWFSWCKLLKYFIDRHVQCNVMKNNWVLRQDVDDCETSCGGRAVIWRGCWLLMVSCRTTLPKKMRAADWKDINEFRPLSIYTHSLSIKFRLTIACA